MAYNNKRGWYKLANPEKFVKPIDKHMKSFNESEESVEYKSKLELNSFRYADANPHVIYR